MTFVVAAAASQCRCLRAPPFHYSRPHRAIAGAKSLARASASSAQLTERNASNARFFYRLTLWGSSPRRG
jgi:hypothetical protein